MQTGDIQVLALFCFLPVATGGAAFAFFFRYRQHREPLRWSRLLFGNFLVLLWFGSLGVLGGEIYYRYFYNTTDSFGLSRITLRWFDRHFHYNEVGFRDSVEYSRQVAPGHRRVTFLGDSFTAGHGIADVEQRFANRVRATLPNGEVHVFAEPGWDTLQHVEVATALPADGFQLGLVVLVYCLNDLTDLVPEWMEIQRRIYEPDLPAFFVKNSFLVNTWHYRRKSAGDPDVANYFQFVRDHYQGPVWRAQRARLVSLKETIEKFDGRLVVVTFPFMHELGAAYSYHDVHDQLGRLWDELGVAHLDLLETFESYQAADMVVNRYDAHPNDQAHAIAADAIGPFLQQQLDATDLQPAEERATDKD